MTKSVVWVSVVIVPCLVVGCAGQDDPVQQKVKVLEEAAGVMENVYTEGAAPATKPELKRLGDRLKQLDQTIAALPADKRAEMEKKHQAALDAAVNRVKNKEMRMRAIKDGGDAYNQLGLK